MGHPVYDNTNIIYIYKESVFAPFFSSSLEVKIIYYRRIRPARVNRITALWTSEGGAIALG